MQLVVALLAAGVTAGPLYLYELGVSEPLSGCVRNKTLHIIRHAEGHHNADELEAERSQIHLKDPAHAKLREEYGIAWMLLESVSGRRYHDPLLTPKGREQAYQLRSTLRSDHAFAADVVVFSPMRRTIETALLSLPPLEAVATSFPINPHLSDESPPPRLIASDLLRERVGPFMCDSRLSRTELQREYAGLGLNVTVDFSDVAELDEMFAEGGERDEPEVGSPRLATRAAAALAWIHTLPEARVVVVAHRHILHAMTSLYPNGVSEAPFANAERRAYLLCEEPSEPNAEITESAEAESEGQGEAGPSASTSDQPGNVAPSALVQPVRARVKPLAGP